MAPWLAQPVDWGIFRDEFVVLAAMAAALLGELLRPRKAASPAGFIMLFGFLWALKLALFSPLPDSSLWDGAYAVDGLSRWFKVIFLSCGALAATASLRYMRRSPYEGAYYFCLGSSVAGMMLLAGAGELISLYVTLEMASISLYVMAAMLAGRSVSKEAGLKYLLVGAFSSALFLYGASLVYQAAGTTLLSGIRMALPLHAREPLVLVGLVFMMAALGFKTAVVPFHMWAPDVYEGGPTPLVAFASTASKAAGFMIMAKILLVGLEGMRPDWTLLLSVMAALTLVLGSLAAIPQTNIRRLLAYSSIAQAGYVLIGFVPGSPAGLGAVLFFLLVYLFTNIGAFTVVIIVSRETGSDNITDYAGLARRSPLLALAMLLALLSLAGIPPLGGFAGKFFLFTAAMEPSGKFLWLVVLGLLLSIASLFYYLLVIRQMYIEAPRVTGPVRTGFAAGLVVLVCIAGILLTGLMPGPILDGALEAAGKFLQVR